MKWVITCLVCLRYGPRKGGKKRALVNTNCLKALFLAEMRCTEKMHKSICIACTTTRVRVKVQTNRDLTSFENYSKCHIWIFSFWHFPPIFVILRLTCLVILFDRKIQVFKNSPKWTIFGIFNQLLSTQNVNVARFARNVEWDFFCDFQTPW